jgi:radical SAM superfamily enzyme YgiQ (UPF0313 family)
MKYRKVLLVNPCYPHTRFGAFRPPTGLGYIAEALRQEGIPYAVLDMALGYRTKSLIRKIETFGPDLLAVTMLTYMYKNTYGILRAIKDKFPQLAIVTGGAHISTVREQALKECEAIDYGVACEGERTLAALCSGQSAGTIRGLIYRHGSSILYNGDRPYEEDLDTLPFPTYTNFELSKYMLEEIDLITSRGCPYGCIYCTVHLASGNRIRVRSARGVVDEMAYWHEKGYRRLEIADDNFSFYKERVHEICDEIARRKLHGIKFRCGNGLRADKVDRDLLKHMKDVGFCHIAFGVESGSDTVLKAMRKGEDKQTLERAINIACELGFDVTLYFIIGLPEETKENVRETFDLAQKYPIMEARFFNPIPYPKTALFQWAATNKLFLIPSEKYLNDLTSFTTDSVYETPEYTAHDRKAAMRQSDSVRRRILRRSVRHKLKGYGPLALLLAHIYTIPFIERAFRENVPFRRFVDFVTAGREGV